jgi:acyl carrier protein
MADEKLIIAILSQLLNLNIETLVKIDYNVDLSIYGFDSLKAIQMVVLLEEKYDIELSGDVFVPNNFNTINKIKKVLEQYI